MPNSVKKELLGSVKFLSLSIFRLGSAFLAYTEYNYLIALLNSLHTSFSTYLIYISSFPLKHVVSAYIKCILSSCTIGKSFFNSSSPLKQEFLTKTLFLSWFHNWGHALKHPFLVYRTLVLDCLKENVQIGIRCVM